MSGMSVTAQGQAVRISGTAEAAAAVIGSMLIDPSCVGPVLQRVGDRDFYDKGLLLIFQTVRGLFMERRPVDAVTVSERLKAAGHDLSATIAGCVEATPTSASVLAYVDALRQSATLARLRDAGARLFNAASMEEAVEIINEANALRVEKRGVRKDSFRALYENFLERHDPESAAPSLPWDIDALNRDLRCQLGHQIVLGAYPGVGKTSFALQMAARMGRDVPVGYYSFESNRQALYDRHVARTALVDGIRIRDNALTEEDRQEISGLREQLAGPDVTIIDAAGMTVDDVLADALASHYWIIYVDYVQSVDVPQRNRRYTPSEYERVTEVSRKTASFAAETGTTVVLLSQFSRPEKSKKGKTPEPTLSSLRSTGQLEQDADAVMLMWREDDEDPDSVRRLKIAKNRHGPSGGFLRLDFDGAHQAFRQIANRYAAASYGTKSYGTAAQRADGGQMGIPEMDDDSDLPF